MNTQVSPPVSPLDYGAIAEDLFAMADKTGGMEKNLYLEKYSDKKEVNGVAWLFISSWLQYFKNDQPEEVYLQALDHLGFNNELLDEIERHPFRKCSEHFFFGFQYYILSFYQNLDFELSRKVSNTITKRSSAYELSFYRKGSWQIKLPPFHIIGKLSAGFAHNYSTLADATSRSLSKAFAKKKEVELSFTFERTPKRRHVQLQRPEVIVYENEEYRPNLETVYRTGISDYISMISYPLATLGILYFKNLFLNSGYRHLEINLLPDQIPRFFDGHYYRMDDQGYFYRDTDPEQTRMVDSFGEEVHYCREARFAFNKKGKLIMGLGPGYEKTNPEVHIISTYNTEKNRFIMYYDMILPWQRFYVSTAMDLRNRIKKEKNIDIREYDYPAVKKILKKDYSRELHEARKKRKGRTLPVALFSLAAAAASFLVPAELPALSSFFLFSGGAGFTAAVARRAYRDLIYRVTVLKKEDVLDYRARENYILKGIDSEKNSAMEISTRTLQVFNRTIDEMKKSSVSTAEILNALEEFGRSNQSNVEAQEKLQNIIQNLVSQAGVMNEKTTELLNNLIEQVNASFNEIYKTSEENNTLTRELIKETEKIAASQQMLNDISEQINLLSLNASIEAARAGDQGRGFAVVADEVSKLAEKSQEGVKEINLINENVQSGIDRVYHENLKAVDGLKKINESMKGALASINAEIKKLPDNIVTSVDSASREVEQIASVSEELTASIEEITANVNSINQVNAETIEQIEKEKQEI